MNFLMQQLVKQTFPSVVQNAHLCAALMIMFVIKLVTGLVFTAGQTLCMYAFGLTCSAAFCAANADAA